MQPEGTVFLQDFQIAVAGEFSKNRSNFFGREAQNICKLLSTQTAVLEGVQECAGEFGFCGEVRIQQEAGGYSGHVGVVVVSDHNRIRYYAMADYLDGAELDELIKAIIDRTAKNEALESKFFDCKNEQIRVDRQNSDDQKEKIELLIELESSRSFASTHAAVEKMRRVDTWTQEEREAIFEIALSNSQVRYIIGDLDVKMFYLGLLRNCQSLSEKAMEVKAMLEG